MSNEFPILGTINGLPVYDERAIKHGKDGKFVGGAGGTHQVGAKEGAKSRAEVGHSKAAAEHASAPEKKAAHTASAKAWGSGKAEDHAAAFHAHEKAHQVHGSSHYEDNHNSHMRVHASHELVPCL